jgi:hypothetical protein
MPDQKKWQNKIVDSLHEIETHAQQLQRKKQSWHFHILTGNCKLNDSNSFAFVLENPSDKESLVHYCASKPADLGMKLVKLLHGDNIIEENFGDNQTSFSEAVNKMIDRAQTLGSDNTLWHHHMLFPDCRYNNYPGNWTILFEDCKDGESIESVSKSEPKDELRAVETLYYRQAR